MLVSAYQKGGQYLKAIHTFQEMQDAGIAPDARAFSALIYAYAKNNQ